MGVELTNAEWLMMRVWLIGLWKWEPPPPPLPLPLLLDAALGALARIGLAWAFTIMGVVFGAEFAGELLVLVFIDWSLLWNDKSPLPFPFIRSIFNFILAISSCIFFNWNENTFFQASKK